MYVERQFKIYFIMRLKYAFLLSIFCVIILSCTDKKPVSQAQAASVQQEDSVPVKKVD